MADKQKMYIAFRRIYEAVPKWEKELFIQTCARLAHSLQMRPQWNTHTYSRGIIQLFENFHDNSEWWVSVKLFAGTEFFAALLHRIDSSSNCVHNWPRTPVKWCSICT